jgi:PAS domain S-box-containing protein
MVAPTDPSAGLSGDEPAAFSPAGLADRRELALVAVERTRMPMVIADPRQKDAPIVLANQAFLDLTGYAPDEVIGRNCRFLQGPDTAASAVAEIRAALVERRELTIELVNYRKDGSTFWNQLAISPVSDDQGRLLYVFGSQLDVTERRRAQALEMAERRLLREVDHRAMNVLALVQAIVHLTRAEETEAYAASVQERVQALARAHTILASCGWRGVPLDRLINLEIAPLGSKRVRISGPPVLVAAQLVQPLALVVYEMMANTTAHGALSTPEGEVSIGWTEDPDGRQIVLSWEESGLASPPAENRRGFGSTMIGAVVQRQLRGQLHRSWEPDGLKARLVFPIESGETPMRG